MFTFDHTNSNRAPLVRAFITTSLKAQFYIHDSSGIWSLGWTMTHIFAANRCSKGKYKEKKTKNGQTPKILGD